MEQKEKSVDRKPPMDHRNPRSMASSHPPPGQSPLWDHWPLIRDLRKSRKTWDQIAAAIGNATNGVKVSGSTVCNFYRRIERRKKAGKRPAPLGYEEPTPTTGPTYAAQAAQASTPQTATPDGPAKPESSGKAAAQEAREKARRLTK